MNSRFWNASGVSVKLGAGGVEVQFESLRAILLGGIAFDTPTEEVRTASSSVAKARVPLIPGSRHGEAASYSRKIPLVSYFPGRFADSRQAPRSRCTA